MAIPWEPVTIPDWAWHSPETRAALTARDAGALLRLARRHGASQGRLAAAAGITQSRISELMSGQRAVTDLAVWHRIAEALSMPDDARMALGLSPTSTEGADLGHMSGEITRVWPEQAPMAEEIRRRASGAREIDVLAVRALGILGLNDSLLRTAVTGRNVRLRVLLLDPECPAAERRAEEIGESWRSFADGIRLSLSRLREVADANPGLDLRVWTYCRLPVWRLIRLDDVLYVSAFDRQWEGHASAVYEVPRTDRGAFWAGYARLFEDLIDTDGTPVIGGGAQ